MVTNLHDHWRDGQIASYTEGLIYVNPDSLPPLPTLFIRLNDRNEVEQLARGTVSGIQATGNRINFKVHITEDDVHASDPDWQIARELNRSGWYCERDYEASDVNRNPEYILVTDFTGHWQYVERSSYNQEMVTADPLQPNTPAIFIRRFGSTSTPRGWIGEIKRIDRRGDRVYFSFDLRSEATEDEVRQALRTIEGRQNGWHVYQTETDRPGSARFRDQLRIPFLESLLNERVDPENFEKFCYWLLRLLGIHEVFTVEYQAGHWDGFFVFGNLAVIYDATLQRDFEQAKAQQIENYVRKLQSGVVDWRDKNGVPNTFSVGDKEKQVWVLTRGRSRLISRHNDVLVKEVFVKDLVELLYSRVTEGMSQRDLEDALRRLGEHGGG